MLSWQRLRWLWTATCDAGGAPQAADARFSLIRVYTLDIPALLKTNRWLILFTAGFFFCGFLLGILLAVAYPAATQSLLSAYAEQIDRLGGLDSITTGAILRNNLRIILLSPILALVTLGLYPLLVVALPGALLGMLAVQIEETILLKLLVGLLLILPHGVFEIPAIVIGSALSLRFALSFMRPVPSLTALENVAWAALNTCKGYVFLVIPLIVTAAWIEVRVTAHIARWLADSQWLFTVSQP